MGASEWRDLLGLLKAWGCKLRMGMEEEIKEGLVLLMANDLCGDTVASFVLRFSLGIGTWGQVMC